MERNADLVRRTICNAVRDTNANIFINLKVLAQSCLFVMNAYKDVKRIRGNHHLHAHDSTIVFLDCM